MLVDIKESQKLNELRKKTGKPVEKIINEILGIHLDEKKKRKYLRKELDKLFKVYRKKHNNK